MSLYGLIVGIAIVVGLDYFQKHNHIIPDKHLSRVIPSFLLSVIIGARIYHVLDLWEYYAQNPLQILNLRAGGLGILGGLIAGIVYLIIYTFIYKISLLAILDSITPIVPLCQSIGRFGNFVNHEIPVWWLESLLDFLLFVFIKIFPKHPTAKYLIGYGLIRLIFEIFRSDTWSINSIKIGQIISIIFIISGIILWKKSRQKSPSLQP